MEYVPLCEPWPLPPSGCPDLTSSPAVTGYAVAAASEVLWAMSGRQFGACEVLIRPCRQACGPGTRDWWWPGGGWSWPVYGLGLTEMWWEAACGQCRHGCGCNNAATLQLPAPAQSVTQVLVDGVELTNPGNYTLYDGTTLVRTDGEQWPMCQDWTVPVSGVGAWSVTAVYGSPVPVMGQLAVGELAAEIAAGCDRGDCRLPAFTTGVSRQGVTQTFPSFMEIMQAGVIGVGLPLVDLFLRTENPSGLQASPVIVSPEDYDRAPRRPWGVA